MKKPPTAKPRKVTFLAWAISTDLRRYAVQTEYPTWFKRYGNYRLVASASPSSRSPRPGRGVGSEKSSLYLPRITLASPITPVSLRIPQLREPLALHLRAHRMPVVSGAWRSEAVAGVAASRDSTRGGHQVTDFWTSSNYYTTADSPTLESMLALCATIKPIEKTLFVVGEEFAKDHGELIDQIRALPGTRCEVTKYVEGVYKIPDILEKFNPFVIPEPVFETAEPMPLRSMFADYGVSVLPTPYSYINISDSDYSTVPRRSHKHFRRAARNRRKVYHLCRLISDKTINAAGLFRLAWLLKRMGVKDAAGETLSLAREMRSVEVSP